MADNQYWFARRFPVGHPRNAMAPVTAEGFRAVRVFLTWMVIALVGALVIGLLALVTQPMLGFFAVVWFIGCALYAGWHFISTAQKRGDHQHTVDDYKAGRVK